jgi:hypothetical protein
MVGDASIQEATKGGYKLNGTTTVQSWKLVKFVF